jgi:parvulin-like peptidyl-prolyl isomerase
MRRGQANNKIVVLILAGAIILSLSGCGSAKKGQKDKDREVVVATANGISITLYDLKREILEVRGFSATLEVGDVTRKEIVRSLKRLLRKTLIIEEAKRLGLGVTKEEVAAEIEEIKKDYPEGSFEDLLKKEGIDEREWEGKLLRTLMIEKTSEAIKSKAPGIYSRAVKKYMRDNRIYLGKRVTVPRKWHMKEYVFYGEADAKRGREIVERTESTRDGLVLKEVGISCTIYDLGLLTGKELAGEYVKNLKSLKENELSEVVKLPSSYAFFRVVKIVPKHTVSKWEALKKIKRKLYLQKQDEYLSSWVQKRFNESSIKINEHAIGKLEMKEGKGK